MLMFENEGDIENYILGKAKGALPADTIIGTAVLVFEFITPDGDGGFSIIHSRGVDELEALDTLYAAGLHFSRAELKGFEEYDDDIE
jgi:hypothetical protein